MTLFALVYLILLNTATGIFWNITVRLNPGCITNCTDYNLVHVVGRQTNCSVHFILASSKYISPSVLALYSSNPHAALVVDWNLMANHTDVPFEAIKLDDVLESQATVFTRLVEYDDKFDMADVTQVSPNNSRFYQFNQFDWNLNTTLDPELSLKDGEILRVAFTGNSPDSVFVSNGSVKIEFMISNGNQRNIQLPRLTFVQGLTVQFELHMAGLHSNYSQGRFAAQLGLISDKWINPDDDFVQITEYSINDEITPGIFKMINIHLGDTAQPALDQPPSVSRIGGFIQTRPVCYVSDRVREVKTSRDALLSPQRDLLDKASVAVLFNRSLPFWFYGTRMNTVAIRSQNVSFGTPEDGYYASSNYIVWASSFGFGEPPVESFSALLIGLISLTVVITLSSLLFGTLVLVILRCRGGQNPQLEPLLNSESTTEQF